MQIITLPAHLSPADAKRRDALMAELGALQRAYQRAAEPFRDAIVEIDCRYPRQTITFLGDGELTAMPESVKRALEGINGEDGHD